jgi:hypothetical protein
MMIVNFCSYSLRIVNGGVNAGQQGEAKPALPSTAQIGF